MYKRTIFPEVTRVLLRWVTPARITQLIQLALQVWVLVVHFLPARNISYGTYGPCAAHLGLEKTPCLITFVFCQLPTELDSIPKEWKDTYSSEHHINIRSFLVARQPLANCAPSPYNRTPATVSPAMVHQPPAVPENPAVRPCSRASAHRTLGSSSGSTKFHSSSTRLPSTGRLIEMLVY